MKKRLLFFFCCSFDCETALCVRTASRQSGKARERERERWKCRVQETKWKEKKWSNNERRGVLAKGREKRKSARLLFSVRCCCCCLQRRRRCCLCLLFFRKKNGKDRRRRRERERETLCFRRFRPPLSLFACSLSLSLPQRIALFLLSHDSPQASPPSLSAKPNARGGDVERSNTEREKRRRNRASLAPSPFFLSLRFFYTRRITSPSLLSPSSFTRLKSNASSRYVRWSLVWFLVFFSLVVLI